MTKGILWMLFWEVFFVMFILPWWWLPVALHYYEGHEEPKFIRWVINQAIGDY